MLRILTLMLKNQVLTLTFVEWLALIGRTGRQSGTRGRYTTAFRSASNWA